MKWMAELQRLLWNTFIVTPRVWTNLIWLSHCVNDILINWLLIKIYISCFLIIGRFHSLLVAHLCWQIWSICSKQSQSSNHIRDVYSLSVSIELEGSMAMIFVFCIPIKSGFQCLLLANLCWWQRCCICSNQLRSNNHIT